METRTGTSKQKEPSTEATKCLIQNLCFIRRFRWVFSFNVCIIEVIKLSAFKQNMHLVSKFIKPLKSLTEELMNLHVLLKTNHIKYKMKHTQRNYFKFIYRTLLFVLYILHRCDTKIIFIVERYCQ